MSFANKRITYPMLDVAKFLCALLVLVYHYFSEHKGLPTVLEEALSLYAVAVALFMTISGFLTFSKLEALESTKEKWHYVKKQVLRILKIYLLWSIVYIVFQLTQWNYSNISFSFIFWEVQDWIFGATYFTIWFMPSLAVGLILAFWMTEKLSKRMTVLIAILLYVLGSLLLTYKFVGDSIPYFSYFADFANTWLGGSRGWLFFGTPLVLLGKAIGKFKDRIRPVPAAILAVASTALLLAEALILRKFVGNTGIDMAIMMIPVCVFILSFLLGVKVPSSACFIWMRKMSVLIFVTQRIFLTVIPSLLSASVYNKLFQNTYVGAVFVCGGTVVFSALIILLSKRFKCLENLY